jgi:hypothetical protein
MIFDWQSIMSRSSSPLWVGLAVGLVMVLYLVLMSINSYLPSVLLISAIVGYFVYYVQSRAQQACPSMTMIDFQPQETPAPVPIQFNQVPVPVNQVPINQVPVQFNQVPVPVNQVPTNQVPVQFNQVPVPVNQVPVA